ncbi:sporulation protein YpjB [Peribacillus saganii]|uniref:Sporulation protein YpjB n=1 Tax=Peribacillus saganii TaxID=2303992 RepID=A0A372LNI6_9BACI|nr:sporulation protein YpjB [Peribacillus saganii]RFU68482.1 sporulation protein YpjB [Peribacillus saganii]
MLKKILLLFLFVMSVPMSAVFAQSSASLGKLDDISDEALQLARLHRYDDSAKMLNYFSEQFLEATGEEKLFSMDELRIITVAHNDALKAVKDLEQEDEEKINSITKFRLVMDAVQSTHQPLWTSMEDQMMATFSQAKEAVLTQNSKQFENKLDTLLAQYDMIQPSLKIDLDPERVQKLDARLSFINQYRPQVFSEKASQKELDELHDDLVSIFDEMTEDETDPSLWWVIFTTGSIIISTLSYVGWRKYKGDKEKQKPSKGQND